MKTLFTLGLLLLFACQSQNDSPQAPAPEQAATPEDPLAGAWSLADIYVISKESGDTTRWEQNEYKLYANGHVMWGLETPEDSTEWFGYGEYTVEGDSLKEVMHSGSQAFRNVLEDAGNSFNMKLVFSGNTYTQIREQDSVLSYEVWERLD